MEKVPDKLSLDETDTDSTRSQSPIDEALIPTHSVLDSIVNFHNEL